MRIPLSLAGLLLASSPALAQTLVLLGAHSPGAEPNHDDPYVLVQSRPWSSPSFPAGLVGDLRTVRFTGHVVPDVITIMNQRVVLCDAPGIHDTCGWLTPTGQDPVYAVAALPGHGVAGGDHPTLDAILTATSNGLVRLRMGSAAVVSAPVADATWNDVRMLATHPDDATVVYGVTSSGAGRIGTYDSITDDFVSTSPAAFDHSTSTVIDIECVNWDNDSNGESEVAVLTVDGLFVHDRLGAVVASFPFVTTMAADIARLHSGANAVDDPGTPSITEVPESIACLRPAAGGGSELALFSSFETQSVPLNGESYVGVVAGDWSGDGNEELVLSTSQNIYVSVLTNHAAGSGATDFFYGAATAFHVAVAATANRAHNGSAGVMADFDADGDQDLFAALAIENPGGESSAPAYSLVDSKLIHVEPNATPLYPVDIAYTEDIHQIHGQLHFEFDAPGGSSTHTEIVLWPVVDGQIDITHSQRRSARVPNGPPGTRMRQTIDIDRSFLVIHEAQYACMVRPISMANDKVTDVTMATLFVTGFGYPKDGNGNLTPPPSPPPPSEPLPPGDDPEDPPSNGG